MFNSILEAVVSYAASNADGMALIDEKYSYTYSQLLSASAYAAEKMKSLGIKKGDYVVIEAEQSSRYLVMDLACEILGAIFVPVENQAQESRARDIFTESGAAAIFATSDYSALGSYYKADVLFEEAPAPLSADAIAAIPLPEAEEIAEILFSTGTTGKPKGIMLTHRANIAVAENIISGVKMEKDAVELVPLPLSHSHGLRTCYAHLVNGSTAVIINGVMNVAGLFRMIEEHKINALDFTPTLAKLLMKIAKKGLVKYADQIVYIELGTAVLEDDVKEDLKKLFPNTRLYNFYGSTEAGRSCTYDFNTEDYSKCIGYPGAHAQFLIVDENRQPMASTLENPGLVAVKGDMMMSGYFKSPELTAETLVDGILYTTDLGYIDEAGRVFVFGRADDVINFKGIKISPEEIEAPAAGYPGIVDCACVAIPDKMSGQAPKLFIQVEDPAGFDMIAYTTFLRGALDQSRVPTKVEIIDLIPRTNNGKLQRKKLREQLT